MNLYFLVEGTSEFNLYPKWLAYLLPDFKRVDEYDRISDQNYFIFHGGGQPEMIDEHLPNAIRDINSLELTSNRYNYLLVCMDAEEQTVNELKEEIHTSIQSEKDLNLIATELVLIIQNRCIETWLLGNRNFVPTQFGNTPLDDCEPFLTYRSYYDVRDKDPELMGVYNNEKFKTHAQFHKAYLKAVFKARGKATKLSYSEGESPAIKKVVGEKFYLEQLMKRVQDNPNHLKSFQTFIDFCDRLSRK